MNIKLGCIQFEEYYPTRAGFGRDRVYSCSNFDFPWPDTKDDKHYVTCPACKQEIPIVIVGKDSAKLKRNVSSVLGSLIIIVCLYLMIMYIIAMGFNLAGIFLILILATVLSVVPLSKAIKNEFYSKGYTYAPGHKIIYK
ncbi:MAG: hypothetical protein P4L35_17630 [Ignavibacteriaceae bacterium]|nr:hypothetical protein [Ignavibacteriaceae bacterium]